MIKLIKFRVLILLVLLTLSLIIIETARKVEDLKIINYILIISAVQLFLMVLKIHKKIKKMKSLLTLAIATIILVGCAEQKPLMRGIVHDASLGVKNSNSNYLEHTYWMFDSQWYLSTEYKLMQWEETHKMFSSDGSIKSVWSEKSLVCVKYPEINSVELSDIKAVIKRGKFIGYKKIQASDEDLKFSLDTIAIGGRGYYYFALDPVVVARDKGLPKLASEKFLIGLIPAKEALIDVKNGCGNITLVAFDNVYVWIPEALINESDELLFSGYSSGFAKSNKSSEEKSLVPVIKTNEKIDEGKYHIVKKGETLTQIANKNNMDVKLLYRLNEDIDVNVIYPGQKIRIK